MKKFISAATSLCMAATSMLCSIAPSVSAADATKTLTIGTYKASGSEYAAQGSKVTISADAISAGDVKIPCAVYLDESTADTQTIAIPITVNSTNSDVKNVKFDLIDPSKPYFDTAKTITTAKGESITTKNAVIFAAGLDEMGDYAPTGILNLTVDSKQVKAGTDNYYIGYGQNFPRGYSWTGSKSDDYPVFVFDVTFPKGTSAGDYKIQFCNYIKDTQGNAALMLETDNARYANIGSLSNLNLNEMTISVEGSGAPQTEGDIVLDFGQYNANPGDKVTVEAKLKKGGSCPVGSFDVKFAIDSPLSIVAYGSSSAAYGSASIETNKDTMQASFICMDNNSDPLMGTEGEAVFKFSVQIPDNCPAGNYNVGLASADIFKSGKNSDVWSWSTVGGVINVGGGGSGSSTTSTTTTTTNTTITLPTVGDIVLDFGDYTADPGQKVTVEAKLQKGASCPVGSYDVKFKIGSPLTIVAYGATSAAYGNASIENNKDTMQASFICMDKNSDPLAGTEGETVFKFSVQIPENCPGGTYNVGLASAEIFKGGKNSDVWSWSTVGGTIKVNGEPPKYSGVGDADKDGKITAKDASAILKLVADYEKGEATIDDEKMFICDVNRDGFINAKDASAVLKYCADVQNDFTGSFIDYLVQNYHVDPTKLA